MASAGSIVANLKVNSVSWNSGFTAANSPVKQLRQETEATSGSVNQLTDSVKDLTKSTADDDDVDSVGRDDGNGRDNIFAWACILLNPF